MKKIDFKNSILPHALAIGIFYITTILFFAPAIFENKSLSQHDILQWEGGAKELIDFRNDTGEEGLWSGSMFGGMPGYLVNVKWSNGIVATLQSILSLGFSHPIRLIFLCFLSYYLLLLSFKIRPYLSIGGALAFGLSSYLIIGIAAGHNARIGAIAFMPMVIAGVQLMFSGKRKAGFVLTALAMAMELRVNHLQITYYLLLVLIPFGLVHLFLSVKNKTLAPFFINIGLLLGAVVLALGTFIGTFWGTYQYSKYSIRGKSELSIKKEDNDKSDSGLDKSYAFQYSNGTFEAMTMFFPNILGGSSSNYLIQDRESETYKVLSQRPEIANQVGQYTRSYWGSQPATAPYYLGAIIFLLAALGIAFSPKRHIAWIVPSALLGIFLAMGSNFESFNYFMFDYFPGYNKFRSVTFALIMAITTLPLLGFIGLEALLEKGLDQSNSKKFYIASGSALAIALFIFLTGGMGSFKSPFEAQMPSTLAFLVNAMKSDRMALAKGDGGRAFVFMAIGLVVIWMMLKKKLNVPMGGLLLSAVILLDSWTVDKRYFGDDNYKRAPKREFFSKTEADEAILREQTPSYRVANLQNPWNDARTSYFHKSIGGYHGAKMRRYQDMIEYHLSPEITTMIDSLKVGSTDFSSFGAINMLNTRYLLAGNTASAVIKNDFANGNGWFVDQVIPVNTPDEEIDGLIEINTKKQALVNKNKFNMPTAGAGMVSLLEYAPNQLTYHVEARKAGLAVFSEIYYPDGWKAYIGEQEADILQVNYILRGLQIPEGQHKVIFKFEPKAYTVGNSIMLVSNVLLLVILLGYLGWEVKRWLANGNTSA